jgi:hypothetical protein
MACFLCGKHGHWSRLCPDAVCRFCGEKGHTHNACELEAKVRPFTESVTQECRQEGRRSRKVIAMTWEDILYTNHIVTKPNMKKMVDDWVKAKHSMRGMVDEVALIEECFAENVNINVFDAGHLAVVGYVVNKYCDMGNPTLKQFLITMNNKYEDQAEFRKLLRQHFGISVYETAPSKRHFRKIVGGCA